MNLEVTVTPPDNDSQAAVTKDHDGQPPAKKRRQSPPPSKVALPVISQDNVPQSTSTKLDASSSKPNKGQNGVQGGLAEERRKVTLPVISQDNVPQAAATNLHAGSSKPNKGQNGVQGGSAEGNKKGKSKSHSEVLQYILGRDLRAVAPSTHVGKVPNNLFPPCCSTPQEHHVLKQLQQKFILCHKKQRRYIN
eukprot:jgi/Psemu1/8076/gm1.8076_g